jgi:formylglycine-generating enzyme required for sulfatase activity
MLPLTLAEERALKPKDSFKECDDCPEMIVVPAGEFMMGSPDTEEGRNEYEGPQHRVTISRPFAVGKFEVTFAEWDACVAALRCSHRPEEIWKGGRQPVISVSWDDITREYLPWLNHKIRRGGVYRLPTEAEWEYAARAGTTTAFWWGSTISTSQANYDGSFAYGGGPKGEYRQQPLTVDSFAPNPWGLYNVHGNVWEWVQDCRIGDYPDALSEKESIRKRWSQLDDLTRWGGPDRDWQARPPLLTEPTN